MNNVKSLFDPDHGEFSPQQTLTIIGLAALTAILISTIPIINILDFPFRLLLTIVHELGHGIAAILTGGDFRNFLIAADGSGLAYTAGGWRFIVIPAGYLGVAIFAALLILMGRSHRWSRGALGVIGAGMLLLSCWFGMPDHFTPTSILNSILTVLSGVIFGAIFLGVALRSTPAAIIFFIHLIAIKAGFTTFTDILGLIGLNMIGAKTNDAQSMAELTHISAVIWALVWIIVAFFIIGAAIKATWFVKDDS